MFALILNRVQNGAKIKIGPFSERKYETATHVCINFNGIFAFYQFWYLTAHKHDLHFRDDDEKGN